MQKDVWEDTMALGEVPVNRAEALDIMNLVKSPDNQKHVKQLTQTERRVVAAMLVALRNGGEVKAPSPEILANIRTKLEGLSPEKTGRQKATQLVKSAWFGLFGVKTRYSSKSLCNEASNVSRQIEEEEAAKFTGTRAFRTACADMKNFYQTLKADYQIPPLLAIKQAIVYKKELQEKVENNNTSALEKAFIRQYQLPAVEAQLVLLETPKNWNTLNSSHWDKRIENWSKPGKMKDLIDQRAGFVQRTSAEMVEWFVGRAQFGESQELMKNMYAKAAQAPEANRNEIFRETAVKLDAQIEHASKQQGLEYRSYVEVLKTLRGEVLEAARSGVAPSRLEARLEAWDTTASAREHVLSKGKPQVTANNDLI